MCCCPSYRWGGKTSALYRPWKVGDSFVMPVSNRRIIFLSYASSSSKLTLLSIFSWQRQQAQTAAADTKAFGTSRQKATNNFITQKLELCQFALAAINSWKCSLCPQPKRLARPCCLLIAHTAYSIIKCLSVEQLLLSTSQSTTYC